MADTLHAAVLAILCVILFVLTVITGTRVAARQDPPGRRPALFRGHRRLGVAAIGIGTTHAVVALSVSPGAPLIGIAVGAAALGLGVAAWLAWSLRRRLPRLAWAAGHRLGLGVIPLGVVHAWIVHPGPMAAVEPVFYALALAISVYLIVSRTQHSADARLRA